jgi:2'-5' RNA ligase
MAKIRCFLAVTLPAGIRDYLGEFSGQLAASLPPKTVRWVDPSKIHLTLRFLGDTDTRILPGIVTGMDQLAASQQSFELQLGELGCFPNQRRPRIIWAGTGGDLAKLQALQIALERMLIPLGWEPEGRAFHPHLTLGRAKDSYRLAESRLPWGKALLPRVIPVHALHFIESRLQSQGSVYTTRHTSQFERNGDQVA